MSKSQDHINILDIKSEVIILKDGGAAAVLKTTAVNFGLLSGEEQLAIIGSFAQMLNSLSFAIQIIIRSKRLDISSYLKLLDRALQLQTNPLLAQMMVRYRAFIQSLIKENEVLDKSFYVIIPLSGLEMGLGIKSKDDRLKKVQTMLSPRRDQVIRQLSRVGLSATPLSDEELIKLFYDIYNPSNQLPEAQIPQIRLQPQVAPQPMTVTPATSQIPPRPPATPQPSQPSTQPTLYSQPQTSKTHPFVVEELVDTI